VIYQAILKNSGYSPLWRSIDLVRIANKNRLHAAVKAVRDSEAGLSFWNYCANLSFPLPDEGTEDYKALFDYFGSGSKGALPNWVRGWWTVYDGSYYYYYFEESPSVVYTKAKPANGRAPPPKIPANRGKVAMTVHGLKITWNANGSGGPTIETFTQRDWSST